MLSVPYSSTSLTRLSRRPVSIEAIAITVETPITMPSTVSALLNLWARMLSSAIAMISLPVTVAIFMVLPSILRECDDRVEPCRPISRIDSSDHTDPAGYYERQDNVCDSNCHWNRSSRGDQP